MLCWPGMHKAEDAQWLCSAEAGRQQHSDLAMTARRIHSEEPSGYIELSHTSAIAHVLVFLIHSNQQLWSNTCGEADVTQEVAEEKVHWSVEFGVQVRN